MANLRHIDRHGDGAATARRAWERRSLWSEIFLAAAVFAVAVALSSCSSEGSKATTPTSDRRAGAPATASPPLGTMQTTSGGNEITVFAVQDPARATSPIRQAADPGLQYAVADVQVCVRQPAGASREWAETEFALQTADNRRWGPQAKAETPVPPEFGYPRIAVGQCSRGWITFQAPVGQPIARVVWTDTPPSSSSPLVWNV